MSALWRDLFCFCLTSSSSSSFSSVLMPNNGIASTHQGLFEPAGEKSRLCASSWEEMSIAWESVMICQAACKELPYCTLQISLQPFVRRVMRFCTETFSMTICIVVSRNSHQSGSAEWSVNLFFCNWHDVTRQIKLLNLEAWDRSANCIKLWLPSCVWSLVKFRLCAGNVSWCWSSRATATSRTRFGT